MSYRRRPSKPWLVVRKQGRLPVRVVPRAHFRTKKRAQKEARALQRAYKPRKDIKFVVRKEGWNRKRWWS
ncbi:MAG: hypothetical protein ABSD73_10755 [Candidatus Bathyarchaeia archaeon]